MPRAQRAPHPSWQAPYPAAGGPGLQVPMHAPGAAPRSRAYYAAPQAHAAYGPPPPVAAASQPAYARFADPHMQSAHVPKAGAGAAPAPAVRYDVPAPAPAAAPRFATDPRAGAAPARPAAAYAPSGAYGDGAPPAVASRIASANAAIAAIHSVAPPLVQPMPSNKPVMALLGLPQLPGGDLKGRIKFDPAEATKVVDEVTAQKSAAEFSTLLGTARRARRAQWDDFWRHRLDLNRRILVMEDECFTEAQEDAAENEYSDEEDVPRRLKPVTVPYMYHNTGSFDIPPARPVVMPDPEAVMLQLQHAQAQAQAQAHANSLRQAQLRAQQAQHAQHAQHAQQAQRTAMSARQRAAQQVRPYRNY